MDQLRALRYFSKVVETGSFTRAARAFDVPPSSLSRRVADLEKSLGATLLKRSTRVVKLTEIGQNYYNQISDILNQLEHSNEAVRHYQARPMGIYILVRWSVLGSQFYCLCWTSLVNCILK